MFELDFSNIMKIILWFQRWDDELAMIAQKWAENCVHKHDHNEDRNIPGKFEHRK